MLPKWNKGPPTSLGEERWDQLQLVAIWLEMSYKILTHWLNRPWLNCKKLSPRKEVFVTHSLWLLQHSPDTATSHSQRAVRIAWYCHPESNEKTFSSLMSTTPTWAWHRRGSAGATAARLASASSSSMSLNWVSSWVLIQQNSPLLLWHLSWFEACKHRLFS